MRITTDFVVTGGLLLAAFATHSRCDAPSTTSPSPASSANDRSDASTPPPNGISNARDLGRLHPNRFKFVFDEYRSPEIRIVVTVLRAQQGAAWLRAGGLVIYARHQRRTCCGSGHRCGGGADAEPMEAGETPGSQRHHVGLRAVEVLHDRIGWFAVDHEDVNGGATTLQLLGSHGARLVDVATAVIDG